MHLRKGKKVFFYFFLFFFLVSINNIHIKNFIKAIKKSTNNELEFWKRTIEKGDQNEDDWDKALLLMQKHDAVSDTRKEAELWVNKAKLAVRKLPETEITLLLSDLADYVLTRSR